MRRNTSLVILVVAALLAAAFAVTVRGADDGAQSASRQNVETASSAVEIARIDHARVEDGSTTSAAPAGSIAPVYYLDWWSVNGGGATRVTGTNFGLGASVGQAAAGYVTGTNYNLGMGFWYGTATACPITLAGDVDGSSTISPADIVYIVNMIFKAGPDALPCLAAADVDCSGNISSGDIIYMVNSIFKAGPPPCNTCTSALAAGC